MAKLSKIEKELKNKARRRIKDIELIKQVEVVLHQPIRPKLAKDYKFDRKDLESFAYPVGIGNTIAEKKSDGYGTLISVDHKANDKIKIYSRQGNEWNILCFPELSPGLLKQSTGVYHGELLGLNPNPSSKFTALDEYESISRRPTRKPNDRLSELVEKHPLKIDIFDILRIEDKTLLSKTFEDRRKILEDMVEQSNHINIIEQWNTSDKQQLSDLTNEVLKLGWEGLIVKDPASLYVPESRNSDWLKIKGFFTFDVVILGFYETDNSIEAGKPFSSMLVGSYNPKNKKFETITKITIPNKKLQDEIYSKFDNIVECKSFEDVVKANENISINPSMKRVAKKIPNRIVNYSLGDDIQIIEVNVLDVTYSKNWHSCGLDYDGEKAHSFRISTFNKLRDDKKKLEDVTTTKQIHDFFLSI